MAKTKVSFEGIPDKRKVGVPKKKIERKKRSDPKFMNYLLQCLDTGKHKHMLKYVNDERKEFEVIYTDKKNKRIWNKNDVSLFKDLNRHLEDELHRKHDHDKDELWKSRFRANMNKAFGKYVKEIGSEKIDKCKRKVKYEILERPKPLVGKAKKNNGDTERKSPRKKIDKDKNMEISLQDDNQVEFSKALTSIPLGNRGSLKKEGGSKIVFNESLDEDIIKQMRFLSYGSSEKEVKKDNHYLCLSGNLDMGENRSDKISFIGGNRNEDMNFIGGNRNEDMNFIGGNKNEDMNFIGGNRNEDMNFIEENRNDKMELGDTDLCIPQFDWNQLDYFNFQSSPLLHDGCENLKDDPFFGNMTDIEDENINNIGDESDWQSNFAEILEDVIFQ